MAFIYYVEIYFFDGIPWWFRGKEFTCQCRRHGFNPWVRRIPWRRKWQPTPVFLPGRLHWQKSLTGYCLWGQKRVRHNLATKQEKQFSQTWALGRGKEWEGIKWLSGSYYRDQCPGKREPLEGGHLVLINSINACSFPCIFFPVYL